MPAVGRPSSDSLSPPSPRTTSQFGAALLLAWVSSACEPELVVGAWACPPPDESGNTGVGSQGKIVQVPWSTGFEAGFCDYQRSGGFCYSAPGASYEIVDEPTRTGRRAAAFSVTGDESLGAHQARCFLEGELPLEATYGAWFYLPTAAENTGNWNLMHFPGGGVPGEDTSTPLKGLWDVSLGTAEDGSLYLYVLGFLGGGIRRPEAAPPVPIQQWFHVEFRLRRANDATGAIALYQDGALLMELTDILTDDTDFGQWYVGNLATALNPVESTVYVDDVTIRTVP